MSARPIAAAFALASIASVAQRRADGALLDHLDGHRERAARISTASSLASSPVKSPVIGVLPPPMPTSQPTLGSTCGRGDHLVVQHDRDPPLGSPGGQQAALPVRSFQRRRRSPLKSIVTDQAHALLRMVAAAPVRDALAGQRRPGRGAAARRLVRHTADWSAGRRGVSPGRRPPLTGWNVSCAVLPMTCAASRGSCTPGQLDDDPPCRRTG